MLSPLPTYPVMIFVGNYRGISYLIICTFSGAYAVFINFVSLYIYVVFL